MGLKLEVRKIKGTPYKIVLSDWKVLGLFDRDIFIEYKNLQPQQLRAANLHHAETFKERFQEVG
jgi:hypothetical protein